MSEQDRPTNPNPGSPDHGGTVFPGMPNSYLPDPATPPRRPARGPRWMLGLLGSFAVLAILISGVIGLVGGGVDLDAVPPSAAARPLPGTPLDPVPFAASPEPSPGPSPSALPGVQALPTECAALYSEKYFATLTASHALDTPQAARHDPTNDEILLSALADNPSLRCGLGNPETDGLITQVTQLDTATARGVQSRLAATGSRCYAETRGTRCVRSYTRDRVAVGESHFLRDGIWIATFWTKFAPENYTGEVVRHVFPR